MFREVVGVADFQATSQVVNRVIRMQTLGAIQIRSLDQHDLPVVPAAFANVGFVKPEAQYQRYLEQEAAGTRTCLVATVDEEFAGYVTINWRPTYPGFSELGIPEIQDLNVLPPFRRRGIASRLLDLAEAQTARGYCAVGIGVGLHAGYNAAQRLYVLRGYIPDGRGVTYRDQYVGQYVQVILDDDLVLHLTKQLRTERQ
jgi:ribosomal protein S18 acetylase RimI-like enzyme